MNDKLDRLEKSPVLLYCPIAGASRRHMIDWVLDIYAPKIMYPILIIAARTASVRW